MSVVRLPGTQGRRPIGYFVHHQGRGHAERCAALVGALPEDRPVTVFCAKPEILPPLPAHVEVVAIPSLFERRGDEARGMDGVPTPDTLHCAPLGWPAITEAMATLTEWFATARPALIVCDVSAEIAQIARICSIPHVKVLQHGDRSDPGHRAAYDGAAGILAPFAEALAQPDWDEPMRRRTCFAGGLGVRTDLPDRDTARRRLGIDPEEELILAVSGKGGDGMAAAPLGIGARALPDTRWVAIGELRSDWHATLPSNLDARGWVTDAGAWIAAADLVVASTGNTTCQQILAAGRPWLAIPEWRYFDEQVHKARSLARAGVAVHLDALPASAQDWRAAIDRARRSHDPERQRSMIRMDAAAYAAGWLDGLAQDLWSEADTFLPLQIAGE